MTRVSRVAQPQYALFMPQDQLRNYLFLDASARKMGINIMAGKGSGKSRLMGRSIAYQDFIRGIPLVIIDPVGGTIDNFLDKLLWLPEAYQRHAWARVIYIDPSGQSGTVVPLPLYYRLGGESLYTIAQRYLDVVRKIDPHLQTASIMGWNALHKTGTMVGMVLTAAGCQIPDAVEMLQHPETWGSRINQETPAVSPADLEATLRLLQRYVALAPRDRARENDSFLGKVLPFTLDPTLKAMFGARQPAFTWQSVVENHLAVLYDLRRVHDLERRRFFIWWFYDYLLTFIKHRGHGRHTPVSLVIDELTTLLNQGAAGTSTFVEEIDALINVIARSHQVWLTTAIQEAWQVDEKIIKALMTMGTQVIGVTTDQKTAELIAEGLYQYRADWTRKRQPHVHFDPRFGGTIPLGMTTTEYTYQEQMVLHSYTIRQLKLFEFLIRPALGEGAIGQQMYTVSIANMDKGIWVNEALVAEARFRLAHQGGIPLAPQAPGLPATHSGVKPTVERPFAILSPVHVSNTPTNLTPHDAGDPPSADVAAHPANDPPLSEPEDPFWR